jgi:hypothetical protein
VTETVEDRINALIERVEEQGIEIAAMRRALISLGSYSLAGGPPGGKGYLAWHEAQVNPPPPPALAELVAASTPAAPVPEVPPANPPSPAPAPSTSAAGAGTPSAAASTGTPAK